MAAPIALDVYVSETRVGVLTTTPEGLYVFTLFWRVYNGIEVIK